MGSNQTLIRNRKMVVKRCKLFQYRTLKIDAYATWGLAIQNYSFACKIQNFETYLNSKGSTSVTRKKSPNVYKSCPKMISQEKIKILTPLQKLPNNVGDFGKIIAAKGFEKLPKVQ